MGQHFTLGVGPAQIVGQHVLPRLYGCRRLWLRQSEHRTEHSVELFRHLGKLLRFIICENNYVHAFIWRTRVNSKQKVTVIICRHYFEK